MIAPPPSQAGSVVDWEIALAGSAAGEPLPTALLGHYELSGELFAYDQDAALVSAMQAVGFSEWRVGVGRWEAATWLLPTLSDGTTACSIPIPGSAAPPGATDLDLIAARDWFNDDGFDVELADTADDTRYELAYLHRVLDVVEAFGATPFVSIDSMPRALSINDTPSRTDCEWTFQNAVTNARPADPDVFAAATAGLVERIVEGRGALPARAVIYWEVWNEPEFPQFWDPSFEDLPGPLDRFFQMAIPTLFALDAYRASSAHPNAAALRFGLASFANVDVAATTLESFDASPLPGGFLPMDFLSFHSYADDPLEVVADIETVAAAAAASANYGAIELVLAEWGPNLGNSAGDPTYAGSIQPALHIATVLALGAAAGLDRAHRSIFWDFHPNSIRLGLLDHDRNPRSAYRAYEMLSQVIVEGALRIEPAGAADGRLDGGNGAVLAARQPDGATRVLLANRGVVARSAHVTIDGAPATPTRMLLLDDPAQPVAEVPATTPAFLVPAEALVVVEFVPEPGPLAEFVALWLLACWRGRRSAGRRRPAAPSIAPT